MGVWLDDGGGRGEVAGGGRRKRLPVEASQMRVIWIHADRRCGGVRGHTASFKHIGSHRCSLIVGITQHSRQLGESPRLGSERTRVSQLANSRCGFYQQVATCVNPNLTGEVLKSTAD